MPIQSSEDVDFNGRKRHEYLLNDLLLKYYMIFLIRSYEKFKYFIVILFNMEKSAFRRVFGNSPLIRVLDFLLEEGRAFDYSLTEIAKNSGVAWSTLHEIFPRLERLGFVKETRRIAQAKMYKLNEENPIVQELIELDKKISEHFIHIELAKQKEISESVAVHAS